MLALKHQSQADGLLAPDPVFVAAPLPANDRKAMRKTNKNDAK
jgi:hypothetical protein